MPLSIPLRRGLGALVLAAAIDAAPAAGSEATAPPVVVELYTSQGCNSCPPADTFLGTLAGQPGVIALSFHVDYWNYLGWADPFSSREATYRQKEYGMALRKYGVYTPQIIVQGSRGEVGSDVRAVRAAIAEAARRRLPVAVTIEKLPGRKLRAVAQASAEAKGADIWLILFDRRHSTKILRGENEGKTLTYHNVVREFRVVGKHAGERVELTLPGAGDKNEKRGGAAVLVQQGKTKQMLGAVALLLDE
jgi:hypothetical protein